MNMLRKAFSAAGSFLATPFGVVVVTVLVWHGVQWALDIPINPIVSIVTLIVDVAITYFLLDWLTYFFAQFVLPIHKPEERKEIYERVSSFESGERGPILFVKNG